jgi:hypothetical protein
MSCRNPNSEISAENCETLETLGPKIQNARKCNLKLVGGALKEAIHSYTILAPTSKFKVLKHPKREGRTDFLETLGGSYGSAEEEDDFRMLVQWVLQDLSSDTMLNFH